MRFMVFISVLFLFCCFVSAEKIPLSFYSEKDYLGNGQWNYTRYGTPHYYLNDLNKLNAIQTDFNVSVNSDWNYEVTKGLYSLGVKDDATIGFKYKNKGFTLKLIGLVFYNYETKERIVRTGLVFGEPTVIGNKIMWQLPFDSNYFIEYNNKYWRDVLIFSQKIKDYLLLNRPKSWDVNNTWVGLIYDLNVFNIVLNDFDSNQNIYFIENEETFFVLPERKVYHELHQSGEGDFNNVGLEWQKKRIYYNGYYVEAIPVSALDSEDGFLYWNATAEISVTVGSDDGDETNLGILDLTDTKLSLTGSMWGAGIMFRDIPIEQGTEIIDANLTLTFGYFCPQGCNTDIFGSDTDDALTWGSTNKMSAQTKTTAKTDWDLLGSFTPNTVYTTKDLNVQLQVEEIIARALWQKDNNLSFVLDVDGFWIAGNSMIIYSIESTNPEPKLSINYNAPPPDPCEPDLDEDWVLSNTNVFCLNKIIFIGTGKLYFDANAFLFLKGTKLLLNQFVSIKMPSINQEWITQDGNINVINSYAGYPKVNASHNLGGDQHLNVGWWQSNVDKNDHYVEIDLKNNYFVRHISIPVMYDYKRYTDINIEYFDGSSWGLLWEDNSFNMGVSPDDCDWNGYNPAGTGHYWCDINKSVNVSLQKIRFNVDSETAIAGAKYDLNAIGIGDIILKTDYPRRYVPLILNDSNFNVH